MHNTLPSILYFYTPLLLAINLFQFLHKYIFCPLSPPSPSESIFILVLFYIQVIRSVYYGILLVEVEKLVLLFDRDEVCLGWDIVGTLEL